MDTSNTAATGDTHARDAERLAERLLDDTLGALELFAVYLGGELGLYRALHELGPLTAAELSGHTGTALRYTAEWLEQQAVAGLVETDAGAPAEERRYRLSPGHARVLVDADDLAHVAPFAHMLAGIGGVISEVAQAYRTGAGVPYESYGRAFRHGQGHINRPVFTHELPEAWLAAMPDVTARLRGTPRPRVADVGCGQGWSTLAIARAFPGACVDGLDADASSIADARAEAERAGLGDRIRLEQADACRLAAAGPYDLVMILEVLHDLPRPVEALRSARAALTPGGTVLVVDERVADRFTAPGDKVERMMYGWSVTHCLPTQLVEYPSAATGTVMRAGTVRRYAAEAGFGSCSVLPVENDFFRLYRLDP
ncbi:class I SAM-dependent methyltransferase [Nonomuraea sp. 3-1Str]|uniref:class I SAM-dependent methyltransferase n=1 Tax=Nonomuraea sp. 3-1Str TaxID=2929801 RepID=UPI0028586D1C|nr:class I SAM-dependent methyltransferase [Nonomuraea sp. 3-1Str]MDR8410042.1 class I SAM-dependent methyltransferase [Nonomuraea sp. 3-1Str]